MKHFKLNISRFDGEQVRIGDMLIGMGIDDTGLTASSKRVETVLDKVTKKAIKAAEANEELSKAVVKTGKSFNSVKEPAVSAYRSNYDTLKTILQDPKLSSKSRSNINTFLGKNKVSGLNNLKLVDAKSLTDKETNKVLAQNKTATNLVNSTIGELQQAYKPTFSLQRNQVLSGNISQKPKIQTPKYTFQRDSQPLSGSLTGQGLPIIEKQTSAVDKLRNAMNSLNKAEEGAHAKFSNFVNTLKSTAITWRIVGGFLRGIVNIFADLYNSAAGYEEALNLYRVAMGDYAEEADKWAQRISEPLFLDPKDVMQYAGAFYNLTNGLGASSDAAYLMATNLTQLSYDMSSYLNIDVEAAQAKIQSAITGQARAVASAGVAMQQASLQELAYTLQLKENSVALDDNALEQVRYSIGVKKSVKDMTQSEKTYLRYIQIMRSTKNMQGDLARTIITPANAMRVVRTQFELFARQLGTVIIPIVMKVIPYIMVLTQALQKLASWLGKKLGYQVADVNYDNLKKGATAYTSLGDAADTAAGKASKAADTINRSLAPFDELNVVESESSGGSGGVGSGGVGGAGGSVLDDLEEYLSGYDMLEGLTDKFNQEMDVARENIKKMIPLVATLAGAFATIKFAKKFIEDYLAVKDFLDNAQPLTEIISSPAAQTVGTIAALIVTVAANFKSVNDETDRLKEAWENNDLAEYFKIDSLDELMDKIRTFTFILQGGLPAALVIAGAKMGWFDNIINNVKESFGKAKKYIVEKLDDIKNRLVTIYQENIEPTVNDIKKLWDDKLKPVFDKLHGAFDMTMDLIYKVIIKSGLLKAAFEEVFAFFKLALTPFRTMFESVFTAIDIAIDMVLENIELIARTFKNVVGVIKALAKGDWARAWDGVKNIVVDAWQLMISPIRAIAKAVIKIAEKMVNGVIDGVNGVIKAIQKIKIEVPDWVPKIGGNTYSLGGAINPIDRVSFDTSTIDRLKTGIDFVPNDYYGPVFLDYGERVLTQTENRQYMKGNDEYLSNLSRSSAITNNKQLATEIANAIVDSMRVAEANRQPDITQVYIGNEKVYEGHGTYQTRQADRYGTTYVTI